MAELAIKLPAYPNQTEFNLQRWEQVCADPSLASLEQRIETDRHGRIIMTPPPHNPRSEFQSEILLALSRLLPEGKTRVEVPISTSDGVRAADVAWHSLGRRSEVYDERLWLGAPEICVEVISPSNTREEMADKKALYFDAGAVEVWFCREDGKMDFYDRPDGDPLSRSTLCPDFPATIDR